MRYGFGGDLAGWTFTVGGGNVATLAGGLTITFWTLEAGGTQYTDLVDAGGTATNFITSSTGADGRSVGQIPPFAGPDGVTLMWASANGGPRALLVSTALGPVIATAAAAATAAQTQIASHVAAANPHATGLADLTNVDVAGVTDGQLLGYQASSGKWVRVTVPGLSNVVMLDGAQTVTGPKTFNTNNVNTTRVVVEASPTGQVADLLSAWSGTDTGQGGARQRTTYLNEKGELRVIAAKDSSVAVRVKGQPGQTAHVLQQTDTANNPVAWWEPDGRWRAPNLGHVFAMSVAGNITVGAGKHRVYNDTGVQLTIRAVRASLGTAPTGAAAIVDVNKNGTSIFTSGTRPTIAAAANTSGKATNMAVTTLADGDYLTVDVDAVGSSVAGADLVVQILAY